MSTSAATPIAPIAPTADRLAALELACTATASSFSAAQAEVAAANDAVTFAAEFKNFPGTDEAAAIKQLTAQRAAQARLEKAVLSANRASAKKVDAFAARDAAALEQLKVDLRDAPAALDFAVSPYLLAISRVAGLMAPADDQNRQALASFAGTQAEGLEAGLPRVDPTRGSLAAALPDLLDPRPGVTGLLATALAVSIWYDEAPSRVRQAQARVEEGAAAEVRQRRNDALSGRLGLAVHDAMVAELRLSAQNTVGRLVG
jgi:hypothetical protein